MAQNPLLGNRISLISKKNIRYEGTLYSINEQNATVALQNVRSYGTEGRENTDPSTTFVAPQDAVHPYLLFRGCDIKDLHVHEEADAKPSDDPAIVSNEVPPSAQSSNISMPAPPPPPQPQDTNGNENEAPSGSHQPRPKSAQAGRGAAGPPRRPRKPNPAVGTGASLLNRKARGTVGDGGPEAVDGEFDFQSKLAEFSKEDEEEEDAGDTPEVSSSAYDKDDFFDSISCDALDKEHGIDNRLRGAQERNLNTETFGAVALNSQRRRRRGGGRGGRGTGGRGRDGRGEGRGARGSGGRGRGRGRGRSNSRGGWGSGRGRGRSNNSTPEWYTSSGGPPATSQSAPS